MTDPVRVLREALDSPTVHASRRDPIRARLDELWRPMVCEGQDHGLCVDSCICSRYEHKPSPENAALRAVLDLHHRAADKYCNECQNWLHPCPTVCMIAEHLGVTDG